MKKYIRKYAVIITLLCTSLLTACSHKKEERGQNESKAVPRIEKNEQAVVEESVQDIVKKEVDLSKFFEGIHGGAVFYNPREDKYLLYNSSLCEQETSPYSSFKIISTLIGLKYGVIESELSKMHYTGALYPLEEWNQDMTLQEAFQSSCVWYFRQIAEAVGADRMQTELDQLAYGNGDISEWNGSGMNPMQELNGFWLGSTLKISPLRQVQVLASIVGGKSNFEDAHINTLKKIMFVADSGEQKIYGKTGSGLDGQAWFVGFLEKNNDIEYFAIYLEDSNQKERVSGKIAKEISAAILPAAFCSP